VVLATQKKKIKNINTKKQTNKSPETKQEERKMENHIKSKTNKQKRLLAVGTRTKLSVVLACTQQ
jgi:hypothetical protein